VYCDCMVASSYVMIYSSYRQKGIESKLLRDEHPDVCAMVVTSADEGKVGNSTGIMPLMSTL